MNETYETEQSDGEEVSQSASDTEHDPLEYDEWQRMLKDNLGTIVRDVDSRREEVRFSKSRWPNMHSTVIKAAVWYTTKTKRPIYTGFVLRSIESTTGRSSLSDGNKHFDNYAEAVGWVECLAEEYGGESLVWRDLPKIPVHRDGERYVYPDADQEINEHD